MKRLLVLFLFIVLIIGGIYAWMFLRPTPEKVLKKALNGLVELSLTTIQGSVQWETKDEHGNDRFGGWASYAGAVNLTDLAHIRANGMAGYSSTPEQADVQTFNVVLAPEQILFQPKSAKPELLNWFGTYSGSVDTVKETWFSLDRAKLLNELGYSQAIARGSGGQIRTALRNADIYQWIRITSSTEQLYGGREYMVIRFKINDEQLMNGLLSLMTAWNATNPKEGDIAWSKRIAKNASEGEWTVTIDERGDDLLTLAGQWKMLNEREETIGKASVSMAFGIGNSQSVVLPKERVDLTPVLYPDKKGNLPFASDRTIATTTIEQITP